MTSSNSAFQPILPCTMHRVVASMFVRDLALCHYHHATVAKRGLGLRRLSFTPRKCKATLAEDGACVLRGTPISNIEYPDALTWPGCQDVYMDR